TALLGPNGAGKSSLVLAVGGVLRPRPGSVSLDGAELAGRRPEKIRAAGVAIVPEGRRLLPGREQQMVVLAQALVSQPKYLLIDELSLGLAPVIVNQLIPVIRSVAAS